MPIEYNVDLRDEQEKAEVQSHLLEVKKIVNDPDKAKEEKFTELDELYQDVKYRGTPEVALAIFEGVEEAVGKEKFDEWREENWQKLRG